jgi:3-isopropylmalate/(R)-2-methylmalate dehydratase small subunit
MKSVRVISGTAVPLKRSDVDTDQIIPAEWLKRVERTGFEKGLFATWRDDRSFVLNDEQYAGASILVAGPAFGVGSSREHAVWALQQYGFNAIVAPSFSDIFSNNCSKNGLVPVAISNAAVTRIWEAIEATQQWKSPLMSSAYWSRFPPLGSPSHSRWHPKPNIVSSTDSMTSALR